MVDIDIVVTTSYARELILSDIRITGINSGAPTYEGQLVATRANGTTEIQTFTVTGKANDIRPFSYAYTINGSLSSSSTRIVNVKLNMRKDSSGSSLSFIGGDLLIGTGGVAKNVIRATLVAQSNEISVN